MTISVFGKLIHLNWGKNINYGYITATHSPSVFLAGEAKLHQQKSTSSRGSNPPVLEKQMETTNGIFNRSNQMNTCYNMRETVPVQTKEFPLHAQNTFLEQKPFCGMESTFNFFCFCWGIHFQIGENTIFCTPTSSERTSSHKKKDHSLHSMMSGVMILEPLARGTLNAVFRTCVPNGCSKKGSGRCIYAICMY